MCGPIDCARTPPRVMQRCNCLILRRCTVKARRCAFVCHCDRAGCCAVTARRKLHAPAARDPNAAAGAPHASPQRLQRPAHSLRNFGPTAGLCCYNTRCSGDSGGACAILCDRHVPCGTLSGGRRRKRVRGRRRASGLKNARACMREHAAAPQHSRLHHHDVRRTTTATHARHAAVHRKLASHQQPRNSQRLVPARLRVQPPCRRGTLAVPQRHKLRHSTPDNLVNSPHVRPGFRQRGGRPEPDVGDGRVRVDGAGAALRDVCCACCDAAQRRGVVELRVERRRRAGGELKRHAAEAVSVLRGGDADVVGGGGGCVWGRRVCCGGGEVEAGELGGAVVEGAEGVGVGVVGPGENGLGEIGDGGGVGAAGAEVWAREREAGGGGCDLRVRGGEGLGV